MIELGQGRTSELLSSLDPDLLVRLARDVLVSRKHRDVRKTDGPGDGGRDTHSLTPNGSKHLTQVKHHTDLDHACSSVELSQLPMACIKFGYPSGLFLTNARISPQGKREYLDAYPNIALEFLDGEELAAEVLANPSLRALWFNGTLISAIATRTTFPFIVRLHREDRPLVPTRHAPLRDAFLRLRQALEQQFPALALELSSGTSSPQPFEPYRYPAQPTAEEGYAPYLCVTEFSAKGTVALTQLDELANAFGRGAARALSLYSGPLTVVVGRPSLTAVDGEQAGTRTETTAVRFAFAGSSGKAWTEEEWFVPHAAPTDWTDECDAHVTEIDDVRLYSHKYDMAMGYEIEVAPSIWNTASHKSREWGWARSVLALVPNFETWPHGEVPAPDERINWPFESQVLCGWFHDSISGKPMLVPSDNGHYPGVVDPAESVAEKTELERLETLRTALARLPGARLLSPRTARHMIAVVGNDVLKEPIPRRENIGGQSAGFETFPSPILATLRQAELVCAWKVQPDEVELHASLETLQREISACLRSSTNLTFVAPFSVLTVGPIVLPSDKPATEWLIEMSTSLEGPMTRFQDGALGREGTTRRATCEYWYTLHGVRLGTPWHRSDKVYMAVQTGPGEFTPVRLTPEDLE
jgi:hypothetical protein